MQQIGQEHKMQPLASRAVLVHGLGGSVKEGVLQEFLSPSDAAVGIVVDADAFGLQTVLVWTGRCSWRWGPVDGVVTQRSYLASSSPSAEVVELDRNHATTQNMMMTGELS
jgi:hypothetical protein